MTKKCRPARCGWLAVLARSSCHLLDDYIGVNSVQVTNLVGTSPHSEASYFLAVCVLFCGCAAPIIVLSSHLRVYFEVHNSRKSLGMFGLSILLAWGA